MNNLISAQASDSLYLRQVASGTSFLTFVSLVCMYNKNFDNTYGQDVTKYWEYELPGVQNKENFLWGLENLYELAGNRNNRCTYYRNSTVFAKKANFLRVLAPAL